MDALIPVFGKVQDVLATLGSAATIPLPQVVVIGAQSSGKSSVLESLVGRDFLPRGIGIVTRRPLVLQLTHVEEGSAEWGEFAHQPGIKFYDFDDIRDEIQLETDRETGSNKGISPLPIRLKVYSPSVVNLTLIDLPGMTKVPVGDQPSDIEKQIRAMVLEYISQAKSIILAVTPANTDLANSDALQMAREVDPDGTRTIGVLTKLDLMDEGTDAVDVLCGRVIPLKLGFIGVINRSQQDIINGSSIAQALEREHTFFARHPAYAEFAYRCGTGYLSRTLNKILIYHIRNALPALRSRIHALISETENHIGLLGEPINATSETEKSGLVLSSLTQFCTSYCAAIDGTRTSFITNQLSGGARIAYIFHDVFAASISAVSAMDALTLSDIRTVIRNATGPRRSLFVPEVSFELLVKRQISRLEDPALQCVDFVFDELLRITREIEDEALVRFGVLRASIHEVMSALLARLKRPTMAMIRTLIKMELSYINTNHPDFLAGTQALASLAATNTGAVAGSSGAVLSASGAASRRSMANEMMSSRCGAAQSSSAGASLPTSSDPEGGMFLNVFFGREAGQEQGASGSSSRTSSAGGLHIPTGADGSAARGGSTSGRQTLPPAVILREPPAMLKPRPTLNEREMTETKLITSLLESYFDIVKKNIQDSVPKAIMLLLVNASKDSVQNELVAALYQPDAFDDLLSEVEDVALQRSRSKMLLAALNEAATTISEVMEWDAYEACEPSNSSPSSIQRFSARLSGGGGAAAARANSAASTSAAASTSGTPSRREDRGASRREDRRAGRREVQRAPATPKTMHPAAMEASPLRSPLADVNQ
ncbi:dynamin-A [Thecamonas trahens ATCC 50062]|uniref:Dynamin-A n=1 Tax=Thecamonas trahens ATCC 50062 TaxID=461836 RepID=A0A0L0D6M9_THETB|nr:dynamin-A [Thecamonas trahens ATCC 50062]KNC47855.1 dynamin-A [Thecamonas trahens ATCC 50062]|eukprot:XP_013759333.1 dynamin-A [Thecamonas trahens ATCC 50062]